jgi:protein phosphatase
MVTDDEICRIIREVSDLSEAGKTLVSEANKNGGSDNITVVLVKPDLDEVKEC